MTLPATLIEALARALLDAADSFDRGEQWKAAVLWPDPDNQFATTFDELRAGLAPHGVALYRLGAYDPNTQTGPAIWLRCLLDADLPGGTPPAGTVPVFLLPGLSTTALRHPQTLDNIVRPLAELQYRGDLFRNRRQARDWSVATFLRSHEQGLGLDVATDVRTDEAASAALSTLLTYPLADLPARRLTVEDFLRLIEPDEVRALLDWIADPNTARAKRSPEEWEAFRALVKGTYAIDVDAKGARQKAVERLEKGSGAWRKVLARVDDSPEQHRAVCEELRKLEQQAVLPGLGESKPGSSADNQSQESLLAIELEAAADLPHGEAIARVLTLEDTHRPRRSTRWAKLGEAPLAKALEPLARLAAGVRDPVSGSDVPALAQAYVDDAHKVDLALLDALAAAASQSDVIGKVARALYWPWVDALANRFRDALDAGGPAARASTIIVSPGTCVLFVDGLRADLGRRLEERLSASENVAFSWRLAPIPTVTATAKPIVTPIADAIGGAGRADLFLPLESSSGKPADTSCLLNAMRARGIEIISKGEVRGPSAPQSVGWTEYGNLDKDGHAMGVRLAGQVENEVEAIAHRVQALLRAGWPAVRVVTDHGWLLVPGGLSKAPLAASIVETKWSRVARLTDGAAPEASTVPWHWDATVRIAVPPGAHAFRAGEAYAHGGVSVQECVVPDILIGETGSKPTTGNVQISDISWRRYKLSVTLNREAPDHEVEVRHSERDPATRIGVERIGGEGVLIDLRVDPDLDEETPVVVVLLDAHGSVVDARKTAIGVN